MAWVVVVTAVAMLTYPGGTFLDSSTRGYSFFDNSFSDLGATVARNGQPNRLSAFAFDLGFGVMLLALLPAFAALTRLYWELPDQRFLTGTLVFAAVFFCAFLVGIGLSPHDRFPAVHHAFNSLAFLNFPVLLLLLALLSARDPRFSRLAVIAWLLLAVVVVAYDVTLTSGARFWTPRGLVFHMTSQKVVAVATLLTIIFEIREAERATKSETPFDGAYQGRGVALTDHQ